MLFNSRFNTITALLIAFLYFGFQSNPSTSYQFVYDYAPKVWLSRHELFFPSSVEFFSNFTTIKTIDRLYWAENIIPPPSPADILPYYHGQLPNNISVPVYAFIMPGKNEKDPVYAIKNPMKSTIVVSYFTFYPYNRGKPFFDLVWDNHVGDIEHLQIYFDKGKPYKLIAYYHSWNTTKSWGDSGIQLEGTHPVVFSANGSHGLWFVNGTHQYHKDPNFYDETDAGVPWNSWKNLVLITPYSWEQYENWAGVKWITHLLHWGDPKTEYKNNCLFDFCILNDGPIGFLGQRGIKEGIEVLKQEGYICEKGCEWNSGIY